MCVLLIACLSFVSIAAINRMTESNLEGKGLFSSQHVVCHLRKSGQECKAGSWRQKLQCRLWRDTTCWITCLGRDGTAHSELSPPTSIIIQENAPISWPTDRSDEGIPN